MIDLRSEKNRHMSTQDTYDILSQAISISETNGFINSFLFERALFEMAILILYPDRKDEFAPMVAENLLEAWDVMLEDGILEEFVAAYPDVIEYLSSLGQVWKEEYSKNIQSARGILNAFQEVSGSMVSNAAKKLLDSANASGVQNVLDIANKWGMNNTIESAQKSEQDISEDGSLFIS